MPDLNPVRADQKGQSQRAGHLDHLRNQQQFAPVHAVRNHAAHQRKEEDRNIAQKRVETQQKRRFGHVENQPVLRDLLHPRADAGREGADPEEPEVAILESFECAAEHSVDGALRKRRSRA